MVARRQPNSRTKPTQIRTSRKKTPNKRPATAVTKQDPRIAAIARNLADPCGTAIPNGFYGTETGYLSRFKTVIPGPGDASSTCGYVLCYPNYLSENTGAPYPPLNGILVYGRSSSTTTVNNQTSEPYGSGPITGTMGTAGVVDSPGVDFLKANAGHYRVLSACIKMTYYGPTSLSGGLVAPISDIDIDTLLVPDGHSPDMMIARAPHVERIGLGTIEHRYRPNQTSSAFSPVEATLFDQGAPAVSMSNSFTPTTLAVGGRPACFGYVWKGLPPSITNAELNFEIVYNVEWVPRVAFGLVRQVPRAVGDGNTWMRALAWLDANRPSWETLSNPVMMRTMKAIGNVFAPSLATSLRHIAL